MMNVHQTKLKKFMLNYYKLLYTKDPWLWYATLNEITSELMDLVKLMTTKENTSTVKQYTDCNKM